MAAHTPNKDADVENAVTQHASSLERVESQNLKDGLDETTARVVDHEAERKLCFKFDIRLMPVLAIMCKLAFETRPLLEMRIQGAGTRLEWMNPER